MMRKNTRDAIASTVLIAGLLITLALALCGAKGTDKENEGLPLGEYDSLEQYYSR